VARAQKISFCPTPQKNFLRPSNFVFVLVFAPPPFWAAGQLFFSGIFDKVGSSAVVKICKHKEAGASLFVFERAMGIERGRGRETGVSRLRAVALRRAKARGGRQLREVGRRKTEGFRVVR